MNIFEIDNAIQEIPYLCVDEETGEIDEEKANKMLESLQMERDKKVEYVGLLFKECSYMADASWKESKNLAEKSKSFSKKADWCKRYLDYATDGKKFATEKVSISFRNSSSVNIIDEAIIPTNYKKVEEVIKVDKVGIKEALKNGSEVPGAEMQTKRNIIIK